MTRRGDSGTVDATRPDGIPVVIPVPGHGRTGTTRTRQQGVVADGGRGG